MLAFLLVWHLLSLRYATFILPGPLDVLQKLGEKLREGTLPLHIGTTLSAAVPGLLIGSALAFVLGYPIAKSKLADRLLSPFIIASQGIPFVAVAPLLFIWFGTGLVSKLIVCSLIVFFPIAINVITGIRNVPTLWHDLFSAYRASPAQRFLKLELPAALPFVFAGLRVGGTLSMIGAITSEFISASDRGLGFLVNQGTGLYDTPLVMLAVVLIVCIALAIYGCVRLVERAVVRH
ncbi:MAG: ABC transporter permease [Anaerolineae bacterium]|nr:ABC transporter permease [Anaerolineae bacterium]